MNKIKSFGRKVVSFLKEKGRNVAMMAAFPFMKLVGETTITAPTVDTAGFTDTIKTMLGSIFTVDNLVTIIVAGLGLTAGLFIFWFAYRFIKRRVEKALKKGSL